MNFVGHPKDIQRNLFKNNKFAGCYIYSRDLNDTTYKLGMSEANLFSRVKTAKSCYPYKSEFFIHMYIVCHEKENVRPLEKKLLEESKLLKKIYVEKPKDASNKVEQGNRPSEYRIAASRKDLGKAVENVLNSNKKLWDFCVIFGEDGWLIHKKSKKKLILTTTTSKTQNALEYGESVHVGDQVYVVFKEDKKKPEISQPGKVIQRLKYTFRVHWDDYNGFPYSSKYKTNEVYKLKTEANYALQYWYS